MKKLSDQLLTIQAEMALIEESISAIAHDTNHNVFTIGYELGKVSGNINNIISKLNSTINNLSALQYEEEQ